jgi:hypothetical protein
VLAIENALGVKYLAGAPEDHTGRLFDSLHGYPAETPARTFSRSRLEGMFRAAGLDPTFYAAFPDYKITRTVLGEFPQTTRSLLHRIPQFPSPDWVASVPRPIDEGALWRTLVQADLEHETGNSFLVLAGNQGASPASLWPEEVAAKFYSIGRRAAYTMQTVVRREGGTVRFHREPIRRGTDTEHAITVVGGEHAFEPGEDLVSYIAGNPDADIAGLMARWVEMLVAHEPDERGLRPLDLVPHNLVISPSGELRIIDLELLAPVEIGRIVRRGVLWMGHHVARTSPRDRWPGLETVQDLVAALGALIGLDADGKWINDALIEESETQFDVIGAHEEQVRALFVQRLDTMPLARRLDVAALTAAEAHDTAKRDLERRLQALEAEFAAYRDASARSLADSEERRRAVEHGLAQLEATRAVRLARRARRELSRLRAAIPLGGR